MPFDGSRRLAPFTSRIHVVVNNRMIGKDDPVSLFLESHYVAYSHTLTLDFFEIWSLGGKAPEC